MELEKICNKHGLTTHVLDVSKRFRCKKCRIDAVNKRRKKLKIMSVEYKGGKCQICSYDKCIEALEFHHKDSNQKDFGVSKGPTYSWVKVKSEIDKCILLCANCHREIHMENRIKNKLKVIE